MPPDDDAPPAALSDRVQSDGVQSDGVQADGAKTSGGGLLRGSTWNLAAQLTPVVVNLVLTPYLIHGLGIDQYGLYALAATITIFLGSFDGGIEATAPRFFSLYAGQGDRRSTTRLLCSLAAVIVVGGGALSVADWLCSPLLASLFRMPGQYRPESVFLLRTFGVLIAVGLLHSLFVSLHQARQQFGFTSKATIFSYLAWSAGLVVTVHEHYGLRGVAVSLVAEQVLATAIIVPSSMRYLDRRSVGLLPRREIRQFFGFAARVQATSVAALVNTEFDALVIGAFLPVRNVGLYSAGANVATQVRYAATSVLPPLAIHITSAFGAGGEEAAKVEMARLQRLWVLGISGWCAAALGATYFAIMSWLGPGFRISALVCLILLAGHSVNLLTGVMTSYAGAVGKPGIETRYGTVIIVVNVVLTVPLVLLGVLGVVSATAVGSALGSIYLVRIAHRRLSSDLPSFLAEVPILRSLLCLGVTVGLELLIRPIVPRGPLGMLTCAAPPLLTLVGYGASLIGARRSWQVARSLLRGRPSVSALFP